ncbi:tetraacyldisaccharide 4'-kinase [Algirhabdus cladophorae]|uniref:tetraacyldisaccharide 4'-kinase n=1 Tax=Algirhabdus cladophorae TaxID=3377108 RepID=UPI003B8469F9
MRPPLFWNRPADRPAWQSRMLSPLAWLYASATARRVARPPSVNASVPVICIGNINAGGTGKTPTTIAVTQLLQDLGHTVVCLTRGYGGTLDGPVLVTPKHTAAQVGDEPLLLAGFADVIVSKDRGAGVPMAMDQKPDVIVMDDGFQNPDLRKDLSIVVVDATVGFGNGFVLPSGPLREPVSTGLARADMLISIGGSAAQNSFDATWGDAIPCPQIQATLEPLPTGMPWDGVKCLAFAGIGHPEKFFATLRGLGAEVARGEALADHQPLSDALMTRLEAEARLLGAQLVTTEKDAVRLPPSFRAKVLTLPVRLKIKDDTDLRAALSKLGLGQT